MKTVEITSRQSVYEHIINFLKNAQKQGLDPNTALEKAGEISKKKSKDKEGGNNSVDQLLKAARITLKVAQPGILEERKISNETVSITKPGNLSDIVYSDRKANIDEI